MLDVQNLSVWTHQDGHVPRTLVPGVSFQVRAGQALLVHGRHGSGRSALLQALAGHLPRTGIHRWQGDDVRLASATSLARLGVGWLSETRDVFAGLTVTENLKVAQRHAHAQAKSGVWPFWRAVGRGDGGAGAEAGIRSCLPWSIEHTWQTFEPLASRQHALAQTLSGGEQQLLALARCLMRQPRLLLLDEPFEGLSGAMSAAVAQVLALAKAAGVALVIVHQKGVWGPPLADQELTLTPPN